MQLGELPRPGRGVVILFLQTTQRLERRFGFAPLEGQPDALLVGPGIDRPGLGVAVQPAVRLGRVGAVDNPSGDELDQVRVFPAVVIEQPDELGGGGALAVLLEHLRQLGADLVAVHTPHGDLLPGPRAEAGHELLGGQAGDF